MKPITMKILPALLLFAFSGFGQQLNCLVQNPVSWWRAEGNATDAIGGNSGTWLSGERYSPGEVGQGFDFDGSSLIEVPDAPNLRFTTTMSFEAWIFPRSVGAAFHEILSKWDAVSVPDQRSYTFTIVPDGRFAGTFSTDGGPWSLIRAYSTNVIPANTWTCRVRL